MKIFSCLSPAQDAALGRERIARHYETGQVVIHSDTPALGVLAVHSGLVKLTRLGRNGHNIVVGLRGPGELLGVREVLSAMPYRVSAETLESSIMCAVPREAFLEAVRDSPELAIRLLEQLAKDCVQAEDQFVARSHMSAAARTAHLLVVLTDGSRSNAGACAARLVSMSREQMALLVGTARETLSRALGRFAEQGAVKLENGAIEILDQSMLERLCEQ